MLKCLPTFSRLLFLTQNKSYSIWLLKLTVLSARTRYETVPTCEYKKSTCPQELLPDSSFCLLQYVMKYSDTIVHNKNAVTLINTCIVNYLLQKTGIQLSLRNYSGEMIDNRQYE